MIGAFHIRQKYFTAISGIKIRGVEIPVFDEITDSTRVVNIDGATCYIVLQGQQSYQASVQGLKCDKTVHDITVRIVTRYPLGGGKKLSEEIAEAVDSKIRVNRDANKIGLNRVALAVSNSIVESGGDREVAFTHILTYQNYINDKIGD